MTLVRGAALTLTATLLLAACGKSDQAAPTASTAEAPPAAGEAAANVEAPAPADAPAGSFTRADVEFAARCHGLLQAAEASHQVQSAAATAAGLPVPARGSSMRWIGETSRRAKAAGVPDSEVGTLLSGGVRILATEDKMREAAPTVQRCIDETPK